MKRFAVAFFIMALFLSNLAAYAAGATFATRRGEIFQLLLNGQLVNGPGSSQVALDRLPAGPHTVEFRLPARRGVLTFCTKVFLDRGFVTNFILIPPGHHPQFLLKKVNKVRLVAPVCHSCPSPRPHGHGYDPYDDYDYYRNQPGNGSGNNYQQAPGNGYGNQNGNYGNNYNGGNSYNGGNNYNNPPGNVNPAPAYLSRYDVDLLLDSMKKQSFENSKLDIAKQAVGSNSVLAEDVKRIMGAFGFESNRVEFAKYAYPRVYDPQNFYRIYDAFEFETSITDMERWLNSGNKVERGR